MTLYDETLDLLQELIRNACVNDFTPGSGQEVRNADTLARFFADTPRAVLQRFEPEPGRISLIVKIEGTDPDAEPLTFMGHIDVVPVDEAKWSKPAFDAVIEDGILYGRGVVDMLFITATMAAVTRDIARRGGNRATVYFAALADEESRGTLGAKWLSENYPEALSWRNCLSETGGSHLPGRDGSDSVIIYVGEKGAAQRRLHVHGDAGHGSAPYNKDSAIVKIARVAERIAAIRPHISDSDIWSGFIRAFRFDEHTQQALIAGLDPDALRQLGELAGFADAISHLTIAQTVLRAGQAINVLPSHAWLEMDIRTLPGQDQEYVDKLLREALGDLADDVEIEHLISEDATQSPTEHPLYEALADTLREFFPDATVVPMIAPGGSDLRFARRLGGVGYGFAVHAPARSLGHVHGQLHSHDEYLHLEDLKLTVEGYRRVAEKFVC
ncbi:M20/M25/M40 family metallo-hydrolase [Corynebacterium flavescens]|uniref:M20/M25/M40 family metallo-hydrolase n=1 Tax=Corynebacterium flavescens TaxID=28028 RepID=UPI003FCF4F24